MREMIRSLVLNNLFKFTCVFLFSISVVLGQKPTNAPKIDKPDKNILQQKLFIQIQNLNDSLLKETIKLSVKERVLLFANLAKIWKVEDSSRSVKLFDKAINEASPSMNDSPKEKIEKFESLQELLPLSVQINDQTTKRIIDLLKSESKKETGRNLEVSTALAQAALIIIKNDPKTGFDLAVAALKLTNKPSENSLIFRIILSLASADKKLAEDFFLQVLNYSQITKDSKSIGDIVLFTSPKSFTFGVDFLSDNSKKNILSVFLDELLQYSALSQQNQLSVEQKEQACVFFLKGKGLEEIFKTYLPERAVYISQVSGQANLCQQAFSSQTTQSIMEELAKGKEELSVDELVQAGFDTNDVGKRVVYFTEAIGRLSKTKEYERIIALLDSMDDELKRALGTANDFSYWKALRHSNALEAVLQKIKDEDYGSARRIIEKTPLDLRPLLQISVSQKILKESKKADFSNPEQILAFDLIADARKNLLKIDDPFSSVNLYLSLINLYAVIEPSEISSVFRETVKAINKADEYKDEEQYKGKDFAYGRDIVNLPYISAENMADISNQIADIQKPYSRVRIKLGVLDSDLKKYVEVKQENEKLLQTSNVP